MKVIVAGSRGIRNKDAVYKAIKESKFEITELVCGMALGVDSIGHNYAEENNIAVKEFPADWKKYGKSAGFIRNTQMANYATALIAIWDGKSHGTHNMIQQMKAQKKKLHIHFLRGNI